MTDEEIAQVTGYSVSGVRAVLRTPQAEERSCASAHPSRSCINEPVWPRLRAIWSVARGQAGLDGFQFLLGAHADRAFDEFLADTHHPPKRNVSADG